MIYKNKSGFEVGTLDFEVKAILLETKSDSCATSNSNVEIGTRKSKVEVAWFSLKMLRKKYYQGF